MVFAFIIHSLKPGECKVSYYKEFIQLPEKAKIKNKDDYIISSATRVQSEYQFQRAVSQKTANDDGYRQDFDDTFTDMESGTCSHDGMILIWTGTIDTCFTLVCSYDENRYLAETILMLCVRYIQRYTRIVTHPRGIVANVAKIVVILHKFLPDGTLLLMNSRVIRQFEKEMEQSLKI